EGERQIPPWCDILAEKSSLTAGLAGANHVRFELHALHAATGAGVHAEDVESAGDSGARRSGRSGRPTPRAVPQPNGDVRHARSGRDRTQDRRAARDRELAHDEPQLHADEHQDARVAESVARSAARGCLGGFPACLAAVSEIAASRACEEIQTEGARRMSIMLYYGSGSPYAWRAQLALEH